VTLAKVKDITITDAFTSRPVSSSVYQFLKRTGGSQPAWYQFHENSSLFMPCDIASRCTYIIATNAGGSQSTGHQSDAQPHDGVQVRETAE
jgi:hypothetical protein